VRTARLYFSAFTAVKRCVDDHCHNMRGIWRGAHVAALACGWAFGWELHDTQGAGCSAAKITQPFSAFANALRVHGHRLILDANCAVNISRLDPGTLEAAFGVPKSSMFMMDNYGPSVEKMYTQKV
jgi:hypothetical protein